MGELGEILALLRGNGATPKDILAVINPSPADRNSRASRVTNPALPTVEAWRYETSIGAPLNPSQIVRANFFKVDTSKIPRNIYQYAFHIYKFDMKTQGKHLFIILYIFLFSN